MPAKTSVQQLRDLFAGPDVVSHASRHRRGPGVRIPEALGGRDTLRAPRSTPRPGRYSVSTPAPVPAARSRAAGAASLAGAEIWPNADVLIAHRAGRTLLRPDELELHRLVVETSLASHVGTIDDQVHEIVEERMESGRRRQRAEKFGKAFGGGED
jgi:hypothetical protein